MKQKPTTAPDQPPRDANTPELDVFEVMIRTLPAFFPRSRVTGLTGGLIASGTLANLACLGEGPPQTKIGLNGRVMYERTSFVGWLRSRSISHKPQRSVTWLKARTRGRVENRQ